MSSTPAAPPDDRRARRRRQTIDEILAIAEEIMGEVGVNGLTLAEVARRLGVQPPSLYKYFDSLAAVYDELFRRGMEAHLAAMRAAMDRAAPGLPALEAGLEASGRWGLGHPPLAELLFRRPVPRFEPTAASMAPSVEMVQLQRRALADAVAAGQLAPAADSDDALFVLSIMISGLIGQAVANEPDLPWGRGRFSPQFPLLMRAFAALYAPDVAPGGGR